MLILPHGPTVHLLLQDFIKAESTEVMRTPVRHLVMTTCANLVYPLTSCEGVMFDPCEVYGSFGTSKLQNVVILSCAMLL